MNDNEKLETAKDCLDGIKKILNDDNNLETKITDIGLVIGFWRACNSGQIVNEAGKDQ